MEQQKILPLDKPGVVAVLTRSLALLYAQALALGDPEPLDLLRLQRPPTFRPELREWGVGQTKDPRDYALVISNEGDVDWKRFPDLDALAHSHPRNEDFVASNSHGPVPDIHHDVAFGQGIQLVPLIQEILATGNGVVDFARALTMLVPSNQDVRSNYRSGGEHGQEELLFTPYGYNAQAGTLNLAVAPTSGGIIVYFGPALGVRRAQIPDQIVGYNDVVSQFIAPIRISHGPATGPTEIWRGWVSCGWGDSAAGMTLSANPPANLGQAQPRKDVEDAVRAMGRTIPKSAIP